MQIKIYFYPVNGSDLIKQCFELPDLLGGSKEALFCIKKSKFVEFKTDKKEFDYMDGQSLTPDKIKLQQLQELLPEAFSEGKIDWEKLKATLGEDITFSNERYVLNWAGKSEAFKVLQTPSSRTLIPCPGESLKADGTPYKTGESFYPDGPQSEIKNHQSQNIFIEGENLEVLKVLQKSYFGKVKMIYIDPPYNTGSDSFIYPDKFSETKDEYLKRVGDKDEEGYMTRDGMFRKNSKENGQYHSNWLNMMYPRMFLAKNLLREDGVIFISIDDNEVHNLRLLMNEVFGEENFVAQFIWQKKITRENRSVISVNHEYILLFGKENIRNENLINLLPMGEEAEARYKNPDNDSRGVWTSVPAIAQAGHGTKSQFYRLRTPSGREIEPPSGSCWRYTIEKMESEIKSNNIWFGSDGKGVPMIKKFLNQGKQGLTPNTILSGKEIGTTDSAKRCLVELFDGIAVFETPKPHELASNLIKIGCTENDLILDFFSGSGTTAHAIMDLNKEDGGNRKYICVQLPELCDEKSEAYKAGYQTIADIAKERIRRASKKIEDNLRFKIDELKKKIADLGLLIADLKGQLPTEENQAEIKNQESKIQNLKSEIENLKFQDTGFKVLKLSDSNFKQWQQISGKDGKALEEQMKLFVDPVSESATIENMVYELLLKSGKDLNSKIEHKDEYYCINGNELVLMLEKATQEIVNSVLKEQPQKVIALDRLFTGNDQLKTNTALQMKDAGIEFKTI